MKNGDTRVARRPRVAGNLWKGAGDASGIAKVRKSQTSLLPSSWILLSSPRVAPPFFFFWWDLKRGEGSQSLAPPSQCPLWPGPGPRSHPPPFSLASRGCQARSGLAKGLCGEQHSRQRASHSSDQPVLTSALMTHPQLTPSPDTTDSPV